MGAQKFFWMLAIGYVRGAAKFTIMEEPRLNPLVVPYDVTIHTMRAWGGAVETEDGWEKAFMWRAQCSGTRLNTWRRN